MAQHNLKTPNFDKLNKLLTEIGNKQYQTKIGILGSDATKAHTSTGLTNAEIGIVHEMGSVVRNIPRRSFLVDTFNKKKQEFTSDVKTIIKEAWNGDNPKEIFNEVGVVGVGLVIDAFDSGGFGAWDPLSEKTIDKKGSSTILVDSGELKGSVSFNVVENK